MTIIAYDKFTLPNGLDVILHEDHSLPMVAVNVWYHVGSKDEQAGKTGFAHLFEHVMFEGSKHHDRSYFEPLQKVGASLNGSTTADRTNYWETVPSNYLELALWLESDRMGYLLDALDQKRFDVQRDVVKNERRQSYENRPYGMAHLLLQSAVFPSPHPYSWPVIGSMEDLDAAELEDVRAFFRKYYAPSNASLAIAGDFDPGEARRLVERYFGGLPPGPPISRLGRMVSDLRGTVSLSMRDRVQLARLYLVWPTGPIFGPDEAALTMLSDVLGDGRSSRLYDSLVYEKQIARDVGVYNHAQEIAGEFHLQVTLNEGHTPEEAEEALRAHVERIIEEPPSEEELQRAKNRIRSAHVRQLERVGGFGGRADQLNYYNTLAGDPGVINTDLDSYDAVTPEQVRRAAEATLTADHVRLVVTPERPLRASAESLDRTAMPSASAPARFTPPRPRRLRLSNGIGVRFAPKPGVPMVSVRAVVRAGATMDPPDMPGLSSFAASMLPEGTADRSSQQISRQVEFLGAHLGVDVAREHAVVSTTALTSHWEAALDIFADSLRNAAFPEFDLKRMRERRLTDLRRVADSPASIAARASRGLVYGPRSAYGHPVSGTEDVIRQAARDELIAHYKALYGPANTTLVVAGGLDEADVVEKLEAAFGDWGGDAAAPAAPPDDGDRPRRRDRHLHRRQARRAAVRHPRGAPGHPAQPPRLSRAQRAQLPVRRAVLGPPQHQPPPGEGLQLRLHLVHKLVRRPLDAARRRRRADGRDRRRGVRDSQGVPRDTLHPSGDRGGVKRRPGRYTARAARPVRDGVADCAAAYADGGARPSRRLLRYLPGRAGRAHAGRRAPRGRRAPGRQPADGARSRRPRGRRAGPAGAGLPRPPRRLRGPPPVRR